MTTPRATYRLQLRPGFGFAEAAGLVEHLAALGVSHLYLSPSLEAVPGSEHGYDVTDPRRLRDELGGEAGFEALAASARAAGLGIVLDIVPNHVALVSPHNPWWWDVLRHGPASRWARHLDVDWADGPAGVPQVLVPHLDGRLEDVLASGDQLRLRRRDELGEAARARGTGDDVEAGFALTLHEHAWPLRPGSLAAAGLDSDTAPAATAADHERLLALLAQQHYRLADWRIANDELNYRRFFDITTLGAVRVEDPEVFEDTHVLVLDLVRRGLVDGLRIDHPDGLRDPGGYLRRLRDAAGPRTWVVIEKILEADEPRRDWPVDGTVGYEFADQTLGLFLDPHSEPVVRELAAAVTGEHATFDELADAGKRQVLDELFGAEFARLLRSLRRVVDELGDGAVADEQLAEVLREALLSVPVYRTYVRAEEGEVHPEDVAVVEEVIARVRTRVRGADDLLDLLGDVLVLRRTGAATADFVMRFQQLTGPLAAKGVEDTALYRDVAFVARNEVGGDPRRFGTSLGAWHESAARRQVDWPGTMLTTSTHDTKRSEDVRARLAVLSEHPDRWVRAVEEVRDLLAARRNGSRPAPSPAVELLALQSAVGAWPIDAGRLGDYLVKASREQKQQTHWLHPDEDYEAAVRALATTLVDDDEVAAAVERLVADVLEPGRLTSLSQVLLRSTSPGVPDTYQGTELWDLSLVDPDNRRPVDHERRRALLARLDRDSSPDAVLAGMPEGLPKLHVLRRALQLRRDRPDAFGADATYLPLYASGSRDQHVVACCRGGEVVPVAPRLVAALGPTFDSWDWGVTTLVLPDGRWRDVLTGREHAGGRTDLADLLAAFPVALLERT